MKHSHLCIYLHHLAKAALAKNHDEVEVRELDAVLIAIAVVLAH